MEKDKLRYPTSNELATCWPNTLSEIKSRRPRCILLLGTVVAKHVQKMTDTKLTQASESFAVSFVYIPTLSAYVSWLPHPSYLLTYKRKYVSTFSDSLSESLKNLLKHPAQ